LLPRPNVGLVNEDYGWLGVGGGFEDPDAGDDEFERFVGFMGRADLARRMIGEIGEVEQWRSATGLQSLFLVLRQSTDYDQPEIDFVSSRGGTTTYSVAYDWLSPTFADNSTGPWACAGYLALVLAAISQQDDIPLPLPGS
jgi:hypothetical protein